jgi:hypothetical protein
MLVVELNQDLLWRKVNNALFRQGIDAIMNWYLTPTSQGDVRFTLILYLVHRLTEEYPDFQINKLWNTI